MKKLIVIPLFFLLSFAKAQSGLSIEATGSVSPIILDHVNKINDPAKMKDTTLPTPVFTYAVQSKKYDTKVELDTIKAAKLGSEPLNKLYRTYAKIGVGNYSTFMTEFSVASLRSKTGAWGVHAKHMNAGSGPKNVAGEYAGYSQQQVNLWGKTFLPHHTLYGGFDYDRNAVYNYGTASDTSFFKKNSIRNVYSLYAANARITSHYTDSTQIGHEVSLAYYHLNDLAKINEDNIAVNIAAGRYIRTEHLGIDLGVDHNRNAGPLDTASNTIVRFIPKFTAHGNKFDASAGFGLFFDITDGSSMTYFLPQASVSYDVINHILIPYISLGSSLQRNSMRSLTDVNPFLMTTTEPFHAQNTLHKWELTGGLRGSLTSELVYDVHLTRVDIDHMAFFVNTTQSEDLFRNKFTVVYDNVNEVNLHGQLGYQHYEKLKIIASGDYYQFKMATELHPWHTPTLRLGLLGEYNLADKIVARLNVYYLDGQYAKVMNGSAVEVKQLKGLVDANLGLEYRYSKFLSGFINFNNIANQRYQRWYGYPTQRFNFLAGLTYTF